MTDTLNAIPPPTERVSLPATPAQPKPEHNSMLRHARYVMSENPVTGLAFFLFALIAVCALIGPYIVPHDPLASDTAAACELVT